MKRYSTAVFKQFKYQTYLIMDKKEICFLLLVLSFILSIQIYVLPNSCKMEALES